MARLRALKGSDGKMGSGADSRIAACLDLTTALRPHFGHRASLADHLKADKVHNGQ
jgi:hypothetical protein